MATSEQSQTYNKFQQLLRELFQFDCADLDFGIYRIMNYKRDVIEKFITEDLQQSVADQLKNYSTLDRERLTKQLEKVKQSVAKTIGAEAIDPDGNLAAAYHDMPIGKEYMSLVSELRDERDREAIEIEIFNHLYTFFSRYYQDGDFISRRRYSRRQKYVVPHNGEEVFLYWANSDQYYIKTAEYLNNYKFVCGEVTVHFTIRGADVEQNNVQGDKRYFVPLVQETNWVKETSLVTIPFEYRPLTEQEKVTYHGKQSEIIAHALEQVFAQLKGISPIARKILAEEHHKNEDGKPISQAEYHLRQFVRKNTSDFFIHKNLEEFLSRELDFYLKNEVLNLDEIKIAGEEHAESWFDIMRAIKYVGSQIIAFLVQIETFQKMIWEKRKFVKEVQYCITMGAIDKRFHADIVGCESQWKDWEKILHVSEQMSGLFEPHEKREERRAKFLQDHPTLVLDTKFFNSDFVDELLSSFTDLDEQTSGLLVHSENWQALNLLIDRYRNQVKCVYIDPPYNTKMSPIIYKNDYKHSTWLSLLADRAEMAWQLFLNDKGVFAVAIDDEEAYRAKLALDGILGQEHHIGTVVVQTNPGGRDINSHFAISHDYGIFYAKSGQGEMLLNRDDPEKVTQIGGFRRTGGLSSPEERHNSEYAFYYDPETLKILGIGGERETPYPAEYSPKEIYCFNENGHIITKYPEQFFKGAGNIETHLPVFSKTGDRGVWRWSDREKVCRHVLKGDLFATKNRQNKIVIKLRSNVKDTYKPKTIWAHSKFASAPHGTMLLKNILGEANKFSYPKSIHTVMDTVDMMTHGEDRPVILDYFAGSGTTGHATLALNRRDGKHRNFILVEMGQYFDTALLPRLKKVIYAPEWDTGKPKRMPTDEEIARSPSVIKYICLESYEDSLNNVQFDDKGDQPALELDEYLVRYMLEWETKHSKVFLKIADLADPFRYKLDFHANGKIREQFVDIPETFNYLLGLKVQSREVHSDAGRRYLLYRGVFDQSKIVVIWRNVSNWRKQDWERDKKFVEKSHFIGNADKVFVNGDSLIPGAVALDPLFKAQMFSGAGS